MKKNRDGKTSRWAAEQRGVTAIEYALIAALIAVVIVGAAGALGGNLSNTFSAVANAVTPSTKTASTSTTAGTGSTGTTGTTGSGSTTSTPTANYPPGAEPGAVINGIPTYKLANTGSGGPLYDAYTNQPCTSSTCLP